MTNTVLHIDASARFQDSTSRQRSAQILAHLAPETVIRRDLAQGLPFYDETWVTATFVPPQDRTKSQVAALALSDELLAEVQAADTIVIGSPMYNFSIPAVLKAWIDQISRAGVSFAYTEEGPKGLLSGKKVIVTMASGGTPFGGDMDFATPYLKFALGFLGITDVSFVHGDAVDALLAAA